MDKSILEYNQSLNRVNKEICERLGELIDKNLIGSESKVWHGHPVWFLEGNPIVGYSKLKSCVQLLFWSGQSFDEPELQNEGTFKTAQARYTQPEQINQQKMIRWLKKAKDIQWDYKNIVKKKRSVGEDWRVK